jgi:hypothetical protein
VQTCGVPRDVPGGEPKPLEVIDLEPELGRQAPSRARSSRWSWPVRGAAAVVAGAVVLGLTVASRQDDPAPPAQRADTVGRFYPPLDGANTARFVLPSGTGVVLSGDLQRIIGDLGATFAGSLAGVSFRVARGDPSQLFDSLGPGDITRAIAAAGSDVRAPSLDAYGGQLAVLSSGGWTLIAFLSDDDELANRQLVQLRSWRLRPTANGVVVESPAGAVGDASVVLGRHPGEPGRHLELTEDNCAGTLVRTESELGDVAAGYWCQDGGVYVRIGGPVPYVEHALAELQVRVEPRTR